LVSNLLAGLSIALTGLIITFLALGLFGIVINLLQRFFPYKEPKEEETQNGDDSSAPAVIASESVDNDLPVVIATAISYFRSKTQSNLGSALEEGKSGWWASNRMNAQQGLGIRIKRSGK
jgi:Na+-transporting methylmalonyl-CoA/oxaloacetate decarboxylase gamma subunit